MINLLMRTILILRVSSIPLSLNDYLFSTSISDDLLSKATKIVNRCFPNFRIRDENELSKASKDYFLGRYKNCNPSIIEGDMDGNSLDDYALILAHNITNKLIFAIIFQNKKDTFQIQFQKDLSSRGSNEFLREIEPGEIISQFKGFEIPKDPITLQNVGVELIFYETSAIAFYWNKKTNSIQYVWTDD